MVIDVSVIGCLLTWPCVKLKTAGISSSTSCQKCNKMKSIFIGHIGFLCLPKPRQVKFYLRPDIIESCVVGWIRSGGGVWWFGTVPPVAGVSLAFGSGLLEWVGVGDPDEGFSGGIQGQPCRPVSWRSWVYTCWLPLTMLGNSWVSSLGGISSQADDIFCMNTVSHTLVQLHGMVVSHHTLSAQLSLSLLGSFLSLKRAISIAYIWYHPVTLLHCSLKAVKLCS